MDISFRIVALFHLPTKTECSMRNDAGNNFGPWPSQVEGPESSAKLNPSCDPSMAGLTAVKDGMWRANGSWHVPDAQETNRSSVEYTIVAIPSALVVSSVVWYTLERREVSNASCFYGRQSYNTFGASLGRLGLS